MSTRRPASLRAAGRAGEEQGVWGKRSPQILPEWLDGIAGIGCYGLFELAKSAWQDKNKKPGHTSQTEVLGLANTIRVITRLQYFIWSPNLVWFIMALSMHVYFPYDLDSAKNGFALDWALKRFAVNYAVAFSYYGFFYVGLYLGDWAKRKYQPGVYPTLGNNLHNLYYWSLAIVQWTMWECVMMRLWATGKVPFQTDAQVFSSWNSIALNAAWVLVIPLWRDLHFYIAHRFIHIRAIYKYVHSLHHRNADPEPFSGMTMHPVEHLYYFSNAFTPSLYMSLSPLIFQWNFIHLTIAPGAGHSGWEDHFQADQYHYCHHAKFECNYGSPMSAPIDQALGTFREKLGDSSEYTGEYSESAAIENRVEESMPAKKGIWSADGYLGLPKSWDHGVYSAYWAALMYLGVWAVTTANDSAAPRIQDFEVGEFTFKATEVISLVISTSPPLVAMLLAVLSGDRMSWRWPFHKESIFGVFGLFWVLGYLACILPMYHATLWVLEPTGAENSYYPWAVLEPLIKGS